MSAILIPADFEKTNFRCGEPLLVYKNKSDFKTK